MASSILLSRRRLLTIAALGGGIASITVAAWPEPAHRQLAKAEAEIRAVRTLVVKVAADAETISAVGDIQPRRESDLGFRVSGKLVERLADVGATVKRGDILARIDDQDYRNRLIGAEADRASAQASLVEARAAETRIRTLLVKGYTTRANHDGALKNLRSAEARLKSADASLAMARDQLNDAVLRADFDGIVTATGAEPGQVVNVGQMVVRLADGAHKDAVFAVAEAAFAGAKTDRAPKIAVSLLSDPSVVTIGTVREVAPLADATTGTWLVRVSLDEAPAAMRFGAAVSGRLEKPGIPLVALPGGALFDKDGAPAVWVVGLDQVVTLKPVAVARYETDRVLLSAGLSEGDIVVTAGTNRLHENQKVRALEGETK